MGIDYKPPEFIPNLILLFNGKRKSGKDYFVELLHKRLKEQNIEPGVLRIAEPIKYYWAQKHNLDFEQLMSSSEYKELHRFQMVEWSSADRKVNYGRFCSEAINMANAVGKSLWIVVDLRDSKDYKWFLEFYPNRLKMIKVVANEEVRKSRGFVYTVGIDDGDSEVDLDYFQDWDLIVTNNGTENDKLDLALDTIMQWIKSAL
jgi:phosphomevalonate kinase